LKEERNAMRVKIRIVLELEKEINDTMMEEKKRQIGYLFSLPDYKVKSVTVNKTIEQSNEEPLKIHWNGVLKRFENITPMMIQEWKNIYTDVDVEKEIKKAEMWCLMQNPNDLIKRSKWGMFLIKWFQNAWKHRPRQTITQTPEIPEEKTAYKRLI
jgi:hypothetical protein